MVFSHDEDDGSALIEVAFLDIGTEAALVLASEAT